MKTKKWPKAKSRTKNPKLYLFKIFVNDPSFQFQHVQKQVFYMSTHHFFSINNWNYIFSIYLLFYVFLVCELLTLIFASPAIYKWHCQKKCEMQVNLYDSYFILFIFKNNMMIASIGNGISIVMLGFLLKKYPHTTKWRHLSKEKLDKILRMRLRFLLPILIFI